MSQKKSKIQISKKFFSILAIFEIPLIITKKKIENRFRNLPRSIIIGIPLVTVCYILINISYLTSMSPDEMIDSEAVAITFGNRILGALTWLMPLSVTISTFGSANGTLFAAGR